jgi:hypothetical protein
MKSNGVVRVVNNREFMIFKIAEAHTTAGPKMK